MSLLVGRFPFFLGLLHFVTFVASQCQPEPVVAPIQNVALPNGASVRGIYMTVGSNNQNVSFFAASSYNETYIYGADGFCAADRGPKACVTLRGSSYDTSSTTTEKSIYNRNGDGFKANWMEDTLDFGSKTSLSSFAFGVPQEDPRIGIYSSQAQLGLGRNSTFLRALASAGDIGTKAYALFWGLVGIKQTQGSLVLGGLDKSLIANQDANFTAQLVYSDRCQTGMLITMEDIFLNWPNGTDQTIFGESQSQVLQACINPAFVGLMQLPYSYYQNFYYYAGGTPPDGKPEGRSFGFNFWTMVFDATDVYYGGLTIKLQNGPSIRVPNPELVVYDTSIASDGSVQTNTSLRNVVISSLQDVNKNDLPILGRLFLSSAYLMVNQEAGRFFLWQANTAPADSNIVAVDKANNEVNDFCASSTGPTLRPSSSTATSTAKSTAPSAQNQDSKLSGGTIGGIVAGAVAGLAILGAIGYLLLRRRRSGNATPHVPQEADTHTADVKPPACDTYGMVYEEPQELPESRNQVTELDGRAVDSELD